MSKYWFSAHLYAVLVKCGISPTHSGHSSRIRGATTAAQRGLTITTRQVLGRRTSSACASYIRPDVPINNTQQFMALYGEIYTIEHKLVVVGMHEVHKIWIYMEMLKVETWHRLVISTLPVYIAGYINLRLLCKRHVYRCTFAKLARFYRCLERTYLSTVFGKTASWCSGRDTVFG